MIGILPEIKTHKLSLDTKFTPVKRKRRPVAEYKNRFVKKEKCWNIVGADVSNVVKAFTEGQTLPKSITHTNLYFINKVISRVIHDKLESVLPTLISANQSSFLKGRNIIENVLLTQELVVGIRKSGIPANVIIKLDMEKAYDRVS
ncbi:uncharacterized protein LOC132624246 [Lycium barbarum]|uniref:uncharacterized protein LOC132624246 n=1 Tax=Lycium barbarum TaxID=112863 RepID=UPI00293E16F8|nr:uncharacterized protein LOC132624246 [Lycium barbarum]